MKTYTSNIEISVTDIDVEETDDERGYYSFKYTMRRDNRLPKHGTIDGSWSSQTRAHFRRALTNGYAIVLVIQRHFA